MSEHSVSLVTSEFNKLNMIQSADQQQRLNNNTSCEESEPGEEASSPDSTTHNYLAGSYRCQKFEYSPTSDNPNLTITSTSVQNIRRASIMPEDLNNCDGLIQIPIVGYEVMEERARFTVYKLRVENKTSGDCWYVFRRYTDFVRLCNRLKKTYPSLAVLMPRKKYFGNNFDPRFLEKRISGLQTFVNAVISMPELISSTQIQDFFCLNEPPAYSDTTEESRAIFEALEDTIYHLRHQLREKDALVDSLQLRLSDQTVECDHLQRFLRNSTKNCQKCSKDYENYQQTITDKLEEKDNLNESVTNTLNSNK